MTVSDLDIKNKKYVCMCRLFSSRRAREAVKNTKIKILQKTT